MAEAEKKGFVGSKAFILIILWFVMGLVLSGVVYVAAPKMEHACEAWAEEYHLDAHGGGHGGGHDVCHVVYASEEVTGFKKNLAASFSPIIGKMKWATAWSIPNFLILITFLWHVAKDPMNQNLKTRREELEKAITEAEAARAEAEAMRDEYQRKLGEMDKAVEEIRKEMRDLGEAEKTRIVAEAKKLAERIQNDADFTAKQELLVARYQLREEAARLAVKIAQDVISQVINDEDRDRLLSEYLEKVMEQG